MYKILKGTLVKYFIIPLYKRILDDNMYIYHRIKGIFIQVFIKLRFDVKEYRGKNLNSFLFQKYNN